jgi:hypothetical protein
MPAEKQATAERADAAGSIGFFMVDWPQVCSKKLPENYTDMTRYPRAKVMALKPVKLCYEQAKEICRKPKI